MMEGGVLENLNGGSMFRYMGELQVDEGKYQELLASPKNAIKTNLGLSIEEDIHIKTDYKPLSQEEIKLIKETVKKDMNGTLSNEFLDSASNRLAILVLVALAAAAAYFVLVLWGPD